MASSSPEMEQLECELRNYYDPDKWERIAQEIWIWVLGVTRGIVAWDRVLPVTK
ncbi:MAG: hypothetical protein PWP64_1552, partial [Candidatus Cloacimonadota bacterium]|nr:hypothetical protein [Candidatus Cloacimonadota bacterium]